MNKLITTDLGGFPYALDDIRWTQDATIDSIKGILSTWGLNPADTFILSGCAVTDGGANWNVAEGYISFQGEILKVAAHSVTKAGVGQANWFDLVTSFDPNGLKTFENATTHDTHQIREGRLVVGTLPGGYVNYTQTLNIKTLIANHVKSTLGTYKSYDLEAYANFNSNESGTGNGTSHLMSVLPAANSFIRVETVGKRVHLYFKIIGVQPRKWDDVNGAFSLTMDMPGGEIFKTGFEQSGTFTTTSTNDADGPQGIGQLRTLSGTSKLVFRLLTPSGSSAAWNRRYEMATAPSKDWAATAGTAHFIKYNILGSAVFEID